MKKLVQVLLLALCFKGCSLNSSENQNPVEDTPSAEDSLKIAEGDYEFQEYERPLLRYSIRTLKPTKLKTLQEGYKIPRLQSFTVPESNGFEVVVGRLSLESEEMGFVIPKAFITSELDGHSIFGFTLDESGERVRISVPVSMVDGLSDAIPGLVTSTKGEAIKLPSRFVIPRVSELQARLGVARVVALPLCPTHISLRYQGRNYRGKVVGLNQSTCPTNQLFRVEFDGSRRDMVELLESAALHQDKVSLRVQMHSNFSIPKVRYEVSLHRDLIIPVVRDEIRAWRIENGASDSEVIPELQIEKILRSSLEKALSQHALVPSRSSSGDLVLGELLGAFFSEPVSCHSVERCREEVRRVQLPPNLQFSWEESIRLGEELRFESHSSLIGIGQSSFFQARPSDHVFRLANRPRAFEHLSLKEVLVVCRTKTYEDPEVLAFCEELQRAYPSHVGHESDGYYPLGANITVYPGARLKIDFDEIAELTTAKTASDDRGGVRIVSEVVDVLAKTNENRVVCSEGSEVACVEYQKKVVDVRNESGDIINFPEPCKESETRDGTRKECGKPVPQTREVLDYECDAQDQEQYCPYYRMQDDVIGFERTYSCQTVKTLDITSFLCFGECRDEHEHQCKLQSEKPVLAKRKYLNCREDDPLGTAPREILCRKPKYLCRKWSTACSRYAVNEVFHLVHEDIAPKWRPFNFRRGEYPKVFLEGLYLKFVSPRGVITNCPLSKFPRVFAGGNSIVIKIPDADNKDQPCGVPLWSKDNLHSLYLPQVYLKNDIAYTEERLCGRTEYSFMTKDVPAHLGASLIPVDFVRQTEARIGPIDGTCRHANPRRVGPNLMFTEVPPVFLSGRVSVLGRVLESVVSQEQIR
jgi:hypothetical protein